MRAASSISIKNVTRGSLPRVPFEKMGRHVLGNTYELSLVICGDLLARTLNKKYRKKTYAANVLSFPIGKGEGEIFLNIRKAEREARHYKTTLVRRVALLFVHGCFHLKGLTHGEKMERKEHNVLKKFGLSSG